MEVSSRHLLNGHQPLRVRFIHGAKDCWKPTNNLIMHNKRQGRFVSHKVKNWMAQLHPTDRQDMESLLVYKISGKGIMEEREPVSAWA